MPDGRATSQRATGEVALVRAERTGDVHIVCGPSVKSRGRYVTRTLCDRLVVGVTLTGDPGETTCLGCRAEYIPGEDWSRA